MVTGVSHGGRVAFAAAQWLGSLLDKSRGFIAVAAAVVGVTSAVAGDVLGVSPAYRSAVVRGERNAAFLVALTNMDASAISDVKVRSVQLESDGKPVAESTCQVGSLAAYGSSQLSVQVETRLRPGWRKLDIAVSGRRHNGDALYERHAIDYGIGPTRGDRMIAQMWHYSQVGTDDPERAVADFGFTHGFNSFYMKDLKTLSPEWKAEEIRRLDRAVMHGIMLTSGVVVHYPGGKPSDRFLRKGRDGAPAKIRVRKSYLPQPEVGNPELVSYIRKFTETEAGFVSPHPGFAGVLPVTENRDHTFPSFGDEAVRYRADTGRDVPDTVTNKVYNLKLAEARFPDGVVPDDDEILAYYTWFWRGGDGWPGYISAAAEAFESRFAPNDEYRFSFWDPAVRCPPIWGSGGSVQMLNQWCYANPEPLNVAGPAEEMLSMTSGRPGQRTSIMTQLICYRAQLAPKGVDVSPAPAWLSRTPDANFVTIPPDVLDEATWCMMAKPVDAIMYHGWGTVFETGEKKSYCFTNGESADRLTRLLRDVLAPLGPTLKRLGRETPRIAVLESFTTVAMGGAGSWGWTAPSVTYLQRARLDPRVIYEDTIRRDGLKDVKVLYAPQCRFLPKSIVARIQDFQKRGGLLVADEQLTRALVPDICVPVVSFAPPPRGDSVAGIEEQEKTGKETDRQTATRRAKMRMLSQVAELRKSLDGRYDPVSDSSSPEIVVFNRRGRDTDYIFAINDHRTFGDYVGAWGRQMEKGLPFSGWVSLRGAANRVGAVYELSRGEAVRFARENGDVRVYVDFKTTDGRLFAFLPRPIASVQANASAEVEPGGVIDVTFRVLDSSGALAEALLPVEVRVYDASGSELDGAGFACADGGVAKVSVLTNLDDAQGDYRVECRDRATGLSATAVVKRRDGHP